MSGHLWLLRVSLTLQNACQLCPFQACLVFYIKDRLDIEKFPMSSSTQKALEGGGKDILVGGRRFGQCGNIEDKAKMCLRKPNL